MPDNAQPRRRVAAVKIGAGKRVHLMPLDGNGEPNGKPICGAGNGLRRPASLVRTAFRKSDQCKKCFNMKGNCDGSG